MKAATPYVPMLEDLNFEEWMPSARHEIRLEPVPKRVRALFDDIALADSLRVQLMLETGRLPVYNFPVEDVRVDLLVPGTRSESSPYKGDAVYSSIDTGRRTADNAAWRYPAAPEGCPDLSQLVAFHWKLIDAWYEEDEEVFVHARDPRKRIEVLRSSRHVQVRVGDSVLADTRRSQMLFETGCPVRNYIPRQDVRLDLLTTSTTVSACPLPSMLSSFVGRRQELAQLRRLLPHTRMLTLLGPGGSARRAWRLSSRDARKGDSPTALPLPSWVPSATDRW